jgi:Fe-S cluster assembly scaffold protein SufB
MNKNISSIAFKDNNLIIKNSSNSIKIEKSINFDKDNELHIDVSPADQTQRIVLDVDTHDDETFNLKIFLKINENAKLEFLDESTYKGNSNFELITKLKKNACLESYKLNKFNKNKINNFYHDCSLLESSSFKDYIFSNGSKENLNRTTINLNDINSSYLGSGVAISDSTNSNNVVEIRHNAKSSTSDCFFKTVARGNSTISFDGTIFVDNHCSKTISNQVSKGLLIGKESKINLVPKLEIYNDDVQCSHGAASGQPDAKTLFYLTSRGISKTEAEDLYIKGFLSEFFDTIDNAQMMTKAKEYISLNN